MKNSFALALLATIGGLVGFIANSRAAVVFTDSFDSYGSPSVVTASGTANGYDIKFSANNNVENFTAIFGFDYSTVTYPVAIPSAPNSTGGTTKGLYLTVNKFPTAFPFGAPGAPGTNCAVNLYPVGQSFSNDYVVKYDVWMNWTNLATSTEHSMVGINHSGNIINRITKSVSDGVIFTMNGDSGSSGTSPTAKDFGIHKGAGTGAPTLLGTNNTTFISILAPQFDGANPGLASLFASKPIYGGTPDGSPGLGWVSGEIYHTNNTVTWVLNGTVIAQFANPTAYTSGNIMLGYNDVFNSVGDTNNFAVFDNIRVESIVAEVSATVSDAVASEAGPDPGVFTITRSGGNLSAPLTVDYVLSGTASNGVDYVTNALSVTIPANQTNATVTIQPIDDAVAELTESVVLTLSFSTDYLVKAPSSATLCITDNEPPLLTITTVDGNMYEPLPLDTATFTITRLGDTNIELFLPISPSGRAVPGIDYIAPPQTLRIPPGVVTTNLTIVPIDDDDYTGDLPLILTLLGGTSYNLGTNNSAKATIRDDEDPPAHVLFSDDFDTDTSTNWDQKFGANNDIFDATTAFSFDYNTRGIPGAPHSTNGSTKGLFVQVNKTNSTPGGSAGINLYPHGQSFSNNFALRFDMFLSFFGASNTTEHATCGINHSSTKTNRVTQSPDPNNTTAGGDGIWAAIKNDGTTNRDYDIYLPPVLHDPPAAPQACKPCKDHAHVTYRVEDMIPSPPFAFPGSPGNRTDSTNKTWADVELSRVNDMVKLKVNNALLLQFTNTTSFTNGNIMIGLNDQFDDVGDINNFVIFDNVRVIDVVLKITNFFVSGTNVVLDFTWPLNDPPSAFTLQRAPSVTGPWTTDPHADPIIIDGGVYRVTTVPDSNNEYWRIELVPVAASNDPT